MSGFQKLPHWFMRDFPMDPYERLVYLTLRSHADKRGVAWPSRSTLAKESGLSESTVKKRLVALEEHGLIRVTVRPKQGAKHDPNLYQVLKLHDDGPRDDVTRDRQGSPGDPSGVAARSHLGSSGGPEEEPQEEEPREEDLRSAQEGRHALSLGDFDDNTRHLITAEQFAYLSDLHIHMNNKPPNDEVQGLWKQHTREEATALIQLYLRRMPRYDSYQGPETGEDVYDQLSDIGKRFADQYMLPDAS
ncbi:helix-turn-helix domain-containing protein [Curtobacterium pusillum]|uniref:helix-turn-helix domain-containing protein n=1 Tax=Curtobacterium pusillum TaxID=69373 RepID=UPI0038250500